MSSYTSYPQQFSVDFSFQLLCTRDAFQPGNDTLLEALAHPAGRPARCLVFVDAGVLKADPGLEQRILRWFTANGSDCQLAASPEAIAPGEAAKRDLAIVERIGALCLEHGICRHSYIIAIGGGAVLDAVGLGAALTHRGVRLIRMPTTVLAQDDAGLGVKNGVNAFGNKNFFGTFAVPHAIINDSAFLDRLPQREWRAGIAEAVKVAIIKDRSYLAWIAGAAPALASRDSEAMNELIRRCALLHLEHITGAGDPFERGSSRPLDFGHWSAHRMEVLSKHRLNHGEAVAIGIALDLFYAAAIKRISTEERDAVLDTLEACGFHLWDEVLELRSRDGKRTVLTGIEQFREHLGGELTLAMPDGLGQRADIHDFDDGLFEVCVRQLRSRVRAARHGVVGG
ncbi:MAG: 3-dehydroquinate synthase [Planctomycetota bacterium]|jgi:3-dehydroquinate synthase|nr:3-dehydroquinate synthase [Planctomycetota bacterium]